MPVSLINSYASCEPEGLEGRKQTAELASFFAADGMKFNFGKFPERQDIYIAVVREWSKMFKTGFRMISENHRGTTTADAKVAASAYGQLEGINVGGIIHFDNDEETYRERFGLYGKYLTHIHCKLSSEDSMMSEDEVRRNVAWLREFGFSGTYTIEFTEGVRSDLSIEGLYKNAVRDMKLLRKCLSAE